MDLLTVSDLTFTIAQPHLVAITWNTSRTGTTRLNNPLSNVYHTHSLFSSRLSCDTALPRLYSVRERFIVLWFPRLGRLTGKLKGRRVIEVSSRMQSRSHTLVPFNKREALGSESLGLEKAWTVYGDVTCLGNGGDCNVTRREKHTDDEWP